jgi:hypothetical protein
MPSANAVLIGSMRGVFGLRSRERVMVVVFTAAR